MEASSLSLRLRLPPAQQRTYSVLIIQYLAFPNLIQRKESLRFCSQYLRTAGWLLLLSKWLWKESSVSLHNPSTVESETGKYSESEASLNYTARPCSKTLQLLQTLSVLVSVFRRTTLQGLLSYPGLQCFVTKRKMKIGSNLSAPYRLPSKVWAEFLTDA